MGRYVVRLGGEVAGSTEAVLGHLYVFLCLGEPLGLLNFMIMISRGRTQ